MLDLVTVTWAIFVVGAPAGSVSFPQVWYREVFLGEIHEAAAQYEDLYLGRYAEDQTADIRIQAAFRAGLCFEKLGRHESARLAYDWIRRQEGEARGARSRELLSEAALRLELMRSRVARSRSVDSADSSTPPGPPDVVPAVVVVREWLDRARASDARLHTAMVALESELGVRRERLMERARLWSRLADAGVLLHFRDDVAKTSSVDHGLLREFKKILPDALADSPDGRRLQYALAGRHLELALNALVSENWLEARSHLQVAGAFSPDSTVSDRWLRWIGEKAFRPEQAAVLAQRRLLDEQLSGGSALRREVRALLEKAEQLIRDRGRTDLAVGLLDRVREHLDWARPALRADLEVRDLSARARKLFEFLARGCGEGDSVVRQSRQRHESVGTLLSLASELVTTLQDRMRLEGRARVEGRPDALRACRAELDRLVYGARDALARGDRLEVQRLLRDGATLLTWVPAVDPDSEYTKTLEQLRRTPPEVLERTGPSG